MLTQFIAAKQREARVWFAGLPGSGKTSAIYKLKLGECLQQKDPRMTVIQESFEYKKLKFIFWEIGNISYCHQKGQDTYTKQMKHIIFKHYYQQTELIIFFIDSTSKQSIEKSREELQNIIKMKPLNNVPIIIFCNKQDLCTESNDSSECFGVDRIIDLIDAKSFILKDSDEDTEDAVKSNIINWIGGSATIGDGLFELLDCAHNVLTSSENMKRTNSEQQLQINELNPSAMIEQSKKQTAFPEVDEDVGNWLERDQKVDDETFIKQLRSNTFEEAFDHYNLIRLIWITFTRYKGRKSNVTEEICKLIDSFEQDEYNVTLIYFWCQIVLHALEKTEIPELREKVYRNFVIFIAVNPDICNSSLLLKTYYSEELLFKTIEKPHEFFMPDIKPLPSLITDVNTLKQQKKGNISNIQTRENSPIDEQKGDKNPGRKLHFSDDLMEDDKIFLAKFEQHKIDGDMWNHITMIRVIWCYLTYYKREEGTKIICERLKEFQGNMYHETLTYFWIHMVEYFKVLIQQNDNKSKFIEFWSILAMKDWKIANSHRYDLSDSTLWIQFYSESVLYQRGYKDIDASKQLCIPDRRNLPSAVCYFVQG